MCSGSPVAAEERKLTPAKRLKEMAMERLGEQAPRIAAYDRYLREYFQDEISMPRTPIANYSDGRPALRAPGETGDHGHRSAPNYIKPIVKDLVSVRGGWPLSTVPPASKEEQDQQAATLITRALRQQHEHSSMIAQQQSAGFFLSCLGDVVYTLDPRTKEMADEDPDPFKPIGVYWNVVNPKHAFPRFRSRQVNADLQDLFVIENIPREDCEEDYPNVHLESDEPVIEVIHYYSRFERQTIVEEKYAFGIVHNLGFCPAEWVVNEATDGRPAQADIAGACDLHGELQDLWKCYVDSLVYSVYPITVIKNMAGTQGQLEIGPGAQFTIEGDSSITQLPPLAQPQAAQLIFDSARQNLMQQTGVAPVRIEGQIDRSNTSARSVDRQQAPMEQRLKLSISLLTDRLQRANSKTLLMLSNIFEGDTMELYGQDKDGSYHQTFTGSDIGGWTRNIVKWDAMLGTTQNERHVAALQNYKEGQGDFPFSEVLVAGGYDDPQAIIEKGRAEMQQRKQLEAAMQPQAPPQGGDPSSVGAQQASLAAGGGGGSAPGPATAGGTPPVQPPPSPGPNGPLSNFSTVAAAPAQPGMGSPAPVPAIGETVDKVLATLPLRGQAHMDYSTGKYVVLVSDHRDIPQIKQALRPVAEELGISISVSVQPEGAVR